MVGNIRILSIKEVRMRKKLSPDDLALFEQFKAYLSRLDLDHAGIYDFSENEDKKRCKKLLRSAAKVTGIPIRIAEENNSLVFYRKSERREKKAD